MIVAGHARLLAARKLGLAKVPVHVATDLTPEQIRAYRIADNKVSDLATWDLKLLPLELRDLRALDVDLGLLGFDQDELATLLGTPQPSPFGHGTKKCAGFTKGGVADAASRPRTNADHDFETARQPPRGWAGQRGPRPGRRSVVPRLA